MPVIFGIFFDAFNMLSQILQVLIIVMVVLSLLFSFTCLSDCYICWFHYRKLIDVILDSLIHFCWSITCQYI